jgi:3-deoxy-D-manno-octulosonic acid kinase
MAAFRPDGDGMNEYKDNTSGIELKIRRVKYRSYTIGSTFSLGSDTLDALISVLEQPPDRKPECLEGRSVPGFISIPEAGPVVVKFYKRGGWLANFNRERYLKIFKTRSEKEFEFLFLAGRAGVSVPVPVAFISRGGPFYRAWLVTKAVPNPVSFMRLCRDEKEKALALLPAISCQIGLLIEKGIHHVDLHPGNILVGGNGTPYFIDFDKTRYCASSRTGLARKYQHRWAKAVRKYSLPAIYGDLNLTEIDRPGRPCYR